MQKERPSFWKLFEVCGVFLRLFVEGGVVWFADFGGL